MDRVQPAKNPVPPVKPAASNIRIPVIEDERLIMSKEESDEKARQIQWNKYTEEEKSRVRSG